MPLPEWDLYARRPGRGAEHVRRGGPGEPPGLAQRASVMLLDPEQRCPSRSAWSVGYSPRLADGLIGNVHYRTRAAPGCGDTAT